MAKKPRGPKREWQKVALNVTGGTGALAANAAAIVALHDSGDDDFFVTSVRATYGRAQGGAGDPAIAVYLVPSDLSATEFEEWLEQADSFARADRTSKEIRSRGRYIKHVGEISGEQATGVLNDGMPVRTKVNMPIFAGQTLSLMFYNTHNGTALTSTTDVTVFGEMTGYWMV